MKKYISPELVPLFITAFLTLVVHLAAINSYDYFRDEFYYIACSNHLDFGYVDHPPFCDLILRGIRSIAGDSLAAIRIVPILLSCSLVIVAGKMAKEFGGNSFAIFLAGLGAAAAPVLLGTAADFSMNVFDQFFWSLSIYFLLRFINTGQNKYVVFAGLTFGIGLETKHLIAFLIAGIALGMLLTKERKHLRNKWVWVSAGLAAAIFLPNLLWQYLHNFPTLEFARNATQYKNTETTFIGFLTAHVLEANPGQSILLVSALWFFFFSDRGKKYMLFGIAYIFVFAGLVMTNGKSYYIAPILPMVFAAGASQVSRILESKKWKFAKPILVFLPVFFAVIALPMAIPILPVQSFLSYKSALGFHPPENERHEMGPLPQHYADMFGWRELVSTLAGAYAALPDSIKSDCVIYTTNYGRAGAIEFFGKQYGLPKVICGHNNYWLWGTANASGKNIIIVGGRLEDHRDDFDHVSEIAASDHTYAMPYERHISIYLGRNLKIPLEKAWNLTRHYN